MKPLRALFLAWCIGCGPQPDAPPLIEPASAQSPAARSQHLDVSRRTAIVDAATRVAPSVLSVNVTSRRRVQSRDPFDFFSFFVPRSGEQLVQSWGTGFVLRSDGIIVTNQHVVENAETITVSLSDGTDLPATLVGEDPTTDIAVLKVDRQLPAVTIGSSKDLLIGEWVVAVGNPYSYLLGNSEPTVTAGVVSATGRNVLPNNAQPGLYLDMIQTDAAINPGNSGGPLTNAAGEVVGVNSFIFSSSGGSVGLGFAIPIERVLRVANELAKSAVRRAWTGLSVAGASAMRELEESRRRCRDGGGPRRPRGPGRLLGGHDPRGGERPSAPQLPRLGGGQARPARRRHRGVRVKRGSSNETRRIITGDLPTVTAAG
ncbi:MAG: trypsin-like peptidase domain-containing protein [Gemmatimonadales bacterium]